MFASARRECTRDPEQDPGFALEQLGHLDLDHFTGTVVPKHIIARREHGSNLDRVALWVGLELLEPLDGLHHTVLHPLELALLDAVRGLGLVVSLLERAVLLLERLQLCFCLLEARLELLRRLFGLHLWLGLAP